MATKLEFVKAQIRVGAWVVQAAMSSMDKEGVALGRMALDMAARLLAENQMATGGGLQAGLAIIDEETEAGLKMTAEEALDLGVWCQENYNHYL